MPNKNLNVLAQTDSGKRDLLDSNHRILTEGQTEQHTIDMTTADTAGDVALTASELHEHINFLIDNATTPGQTVTIPDRQEVFIVEGDSANTESVDVVKGSATVTVAAAERVILVSGVGSNDLFKVGIIGAAPSLINAPQEKTRVTLTPGQWAQFTSDTAFPYNQVQWPVADDDLGLYSVAAGLWRIPADSKIRLARFMHAHSLRQHQQMNSRWVLHQNPVLGALTDTWRAVNNTWNPLEINFDWQGDNNSATYDFIGEFAPQLIYGNVSWDEQYDTNITNEWLPYDPQTFTRLDIIDAEPEGGAIHKVASPFVAGTPSASAIVSSTPIVRPFRIKPAFCDASALTSPTADTIFDVLADGAKFGDFTFGTGGVATFAMIADSAELVSNGGFETGDFTNWTAVTAGSVSVTTNNPNSGTFAAHQGAGTTYEYYQDVTGFTADQQALIDAGMMIAKVAYAQVSADVKHHGVHLRFFDANGDRVGPPNDQRRIDYATGDSSTYVNESYTMRVPPNARTIRVTIEASGSGSNLNATDLDDVSVVFSLDDAIPEPGTVIEVQAPGTLNSIADLNFTIAGELV